jgi:hypothetical protein
MIAGFFRRPTKAAFCGLFFGCVRAHSASNQVTISRKLDLTAIPLQAPPSSSDIDQ